MTAQTPTESTTAERTVAQAPIRAGTRGSRSAALLGVIFVAALVANLLLTSGAPNTDASTAKITSYYVTHQGRVVGSALLSGVAVIAGLAFAVYLRTYLKRFVPEWMTTTFFVGVVIFGFSGALGAGVAFALSDHPKLLSADSTRLLNDLNQNLGWAPLSVGLALMYGAIALMITSAGKLPKVLAGVSWLMALCAVSFFLAFVPLLLTPLFALIASVRLAQRNPDVSEVIRL